jgi:hypothetical protein
MRPFLTPLSYQFSMGYVTSYDHGFPPEEGKAGNEVALSIGQAFSVDQILISETNMLYLRSFEQNIKVYQA